MFTRIMFSAAIIVGLLVIGVRFVHRMTKPMVSDTNALAEESSQLTDQMSPLLENVNKDTERSSRRLSGM
ncbi:hypothetical protein NF868_14830 [Bacillus zhangzhouensis]|nr:hypothetical protein NF868_14830 [Bacillus zhangzhouensis]